jgi:seryl-tRNA synthetase
MANKWYLGSLILRKTMIDIRLIRKERQAIENKLKTKDPSVDLSELVACDDRLREKLTKLEQHLSERNSFSKTIGELKSKKQDASLQMEQVTALNGSIALLEKEVKELEASFQELIAVLPNIPMDDIKVAESAAENVEIKRCGEKPFFSFPFKNHVELNEKLHLFDFKRGAEISGTGWPIYTGMGARLEWALINYMLSIQLKNGFKQIIPPLLVRPEVEFGAGQLPKFASQQFLIHDEDYQLYLIPTAEVPLTGLHMDEILTGDELPLKYCAYTPCFRREAGAAGSQERGLIRTHQFNKVEMYIYCKPEESMDCFSSMLESAEEVLQGLKLHYRNMLLVTGDMSFGSARTVDIEVWLPGQNRYYEVSSVSNCTDYQARRANVRFRRKSPDKPELVHTLNGSGLATSRLMVAILENNQNSDGSVNIPEVLRPYLNGLEKLTP